MPYLNQYRWGNLLYHKRTLDRLYGKLHRDHMGIDRVVKSIRRKRKKLSEQLNDLQQQRHKLDKRRLRMNRAIDCSIADMFTAEENVKKGIATRRSVAVTMGTIRIRQTRKSQIIKQLRVIDAAIDRVIGWMATWRDALDRAEDLKNVTQDHVSRCFDLRTSIRGYEDKYEDAHHLYIRWKRKPDKTLHFLYGDDIGDPEDKSHGHAVFKFGRLTYWRRPFMARGPQNFF